MRKMLRVGKESLLNRMHKDKDRQLGTGSAGGGSAGGGSGCVAGNAQGAKSVSQPPGLSLSTPDRAEEGGATAGSSGVRASIRGYLRIPNPTSSAAPKAYYIFINKHKLLIFNTEEEFESAPTAGVGTRASYTLIGANCRTSSNYEYGFEVNFPSTSSYYKEKKNPAGGSTSSKWLTFLTEGEEESKAWIIAIMQESEVN